MATFKVQLFTDEFTADIALKDMIYLNEIKEYNIGTFETEEFEFEYDETSELIEELKELYGDEDISYMLNDLLKDELEAELTTYVNRRMQEHIEECLSDEGITSRIYLTDMSEINYTAEYYTTDSSEHRELLEEADLNYQGVIGFSNE